MLVYYVQIIFERNVVLCSHPVHAPRVPDKKYEIVTTHSATFCFLSSTKLM